MIGHTIPPHAIAALVALGELGPSVKAQLVSETGLERELMHNALRSLRHRGMAAAMKATEKERRVFIWHLTPRGCRALDRWEGAQCET